MKWWPLWGRRRPARPKILALLACRNEMRYLPDYFASVRPLFDGVVALDDGSTDGSADYLAGRPEVLRLLRLPASDGHQWDDGLNHRRLVEAAWELCSGKQPCWLMGLDADERLEQGFRERAEAVIARAPEQGHRAYRVHVREIWDDPLCYRADGVWGRKSSVRFFEARRDHEFDDRRLHCFWAPLNSRVDGDFPQADLELYHLRMLSPESRAARRARYESLDPNRDFQAIGYAYLTETEGLRLERIQPGREYRPLPG